MKTLCGVKRICVLKLDSRGAWLAHSAEHATPAQRVMSSSPTLGVKPT